MIGAFRPSGRASYSKRLLENVQVMAVGTFDNAGEFADAEDQGYQSVTLQASEGLVEQFMTDMVDANGGLKLMLRNPCEDNDVCTGSAQTIALMEQVQ